MSKLISAAQRNVPFYYVPDEDKWVVEVPFAVNGQTIKNIVNYALPVQKQRAIGLPPGDVKDSTSRSIAALQAGRVEQRVVGYRGDSKGDIVAFGGGIRG